MNNHLYHFTALFLLSLLNVAAAGKPPATAAAPNNNPFTPKAYLIRYWNTRISNDLPKPSFFLDKASPLTAANSAAFSDLADRNSISGRLHSFCSSAGLLCFPDLSPSLDKHDKDSHFSFYNDRNFTNYGSGRLGGSDSFKNYSDGNNLPVDSFRRYSRDSSGHGDSFSSYAREANVVDQRFSSYGAGTTGGNGDFQSYNVLVNVPKLQFSSYNDEADGRMQTFGTYTFETNNGNEDFVSYGKNGNRATHEFGNYGSGSNVMASGFSNYGQTGNGANDTFTSYGANGNTPTNTFRNYGEDGNGAVDDFRNYRDQSNVGDDSFTSYARDSNAANVGFRNYGRTFNGGTDKFSGYGDGAVGHKIGFASYGINSTFKDYAKNGVNFAIYRNETSGEAESMETSLKSTNRWVEPGKFFREEMLKKGTVMPMPDIVDKMPKRSFLPRVIVAKLPFSTADIGHLKEIFHAGDGSSMERILADALRECERPPSRGEKKRCVGSAEDMIDFVTSVLGRNVVVRTTRNTEGSKGDVMIGDVRGINGGGATESVSCHQSLFPYLLYYCHAVPRVRVYEADILDPNSKRKVNLGVAICHLDTSAWSPGHGAFVALGSGPGKIEVCHWIFENDMTWTIAD